MSRPSSLEKREEAGNENNKFFFFFYLSEMGFLRNLPLRASFSFAIALENVRIMVKEANIRKMS